MLNIRQIKRLKMLKMDMGWFEFSYFIVLHSPGNSACCVPSLHRRQTTQNRVGTNWEETGTAKGLKSPF